MGFPPASRLYRIQGKASWRRAYRCRSGQHESTVLSLRAYDQSKPPIAIRVPLRGLWTHGPRRRECGPEYPFQGQGCCQSAYSLGTVPGIPGCLVQGQASAFRPGLLTPRIDDRNPRGGERRRVARSDRHAVGLGDGRNQPAGHADGLTGGLRLGHKVGVSLGRR